MFSRGRKRLRRRSRHHGCPRPGKDLCPPQGERSERPVAGTGAAAVGVACRPGREARRARRGLPGTCSRPALHHQRRGGCSGHRGVTKRCYLGGFVTRLGDVDEPRPRQRNYDKVAVKGPGGLSGCWRPGNAKPFATRAPEVSRACRHSRGQGPGCEAFDSPPKLATARVARHPACASLIRLRFAAAWPGGWAGRPSAR